jgi:hypothetical protein
MKSESVYRSSKVEALGHSVERNIQLPMKFTVGKQPFGVKTKSSEEPAKNIIFPEMKEEFLEGNDLYIRSHGSYGPGTQKKRNYKWPYDPNEVRFGVKGDTIALNGISKNVSDILSGADENKTFINNKMVSNITFDYCRSHEWSFKYYLIDDLQ